LQARLKEAETVRFNLRHEEALQIIMQAAHVPGWRPGGGWSDISGRYALRHVPHDSDDEQPAEKERLPGIVP
jgi:hypothetical protein